MNTRAAFEQIYYGLIQGGVPPAVVISTLDEMLRGLGDTARFCRESLTVRDKRGYEVALEPGPAQLRLFDRIRECRERKIPARLIYLKARQVWVSTAFEAFLFSILPFQSGQRAKVVAHDEESAANIFGYFQQFRSGYRPFCQMLPLPDPPSPLGLTQAATAKDTEAHIRFSNNSEVTISTAATTTTGRSFSLRFLHLSEFAFWRAPKQLMDGLMQAVPDDPDTVVLIESTANGMGGEFYRLWQEASDPRRNSPWIPIFFAWWEHPEYSKPLEGTREAFLRTCDPEERGLIERFGVTVEQLHWRRWCIAVNCGGSVDTFHQEYPSSPEEAFLASGRPRFSMVDLGRMPVRDPEIRCTLEWAHMPAGRRIVRVPNEHGALAVYVQPKEGHRYAIGIDVAEGKDVAAVAGKVKVGSADPDYSVAVVLDIDSGEEVAQLRGRIQPGAFAEMCEILAVWYNYAYMIPEANGPGIAFLEVLQRLDYPMGRVYHRVPDPSEIYSTESANLLDKLGWKTTTVTKPQLVSKLDNAIRERSIILHDFTTVSECRSFVMKANGKTEGQDGEHDDCVIALALAVVGIEGAPPDRRIQTPGAVKTVRTARAAASYARSEGPGRSTRTIRL
jgi:hypothetical protein